MGSVSNWCLDLETSSEFGASDYFRDREEDDPLKAEAQKFRARMPLCSRKVLFIMCLQNF